GEVVRLKSESSDHGGYSYYPIVRFRTETNALVEFKDSVGSNPPSYRVGDKVTVLYLLDNPSQEAIIDRGLFWNWAIPAFLFVGATRPMTQERRDKVGVILAPLVAGAHQPDPRP